jgi:hypothetical protein
MKGYDMAKIYDHPYWSGPNKIGLDQIGYWPLEEFEKPKSIDAAHLQHQRDWSTQTFGPGDRTIGIMAHIEKEFAEILLDPTDGKEWCDVVILALDGAWRAGMQPQEIIDWLIEKQSINERREWPDWKTFTNGEAIEHIKEMP